MSQEITDYCWLQLLSNDIFGYLLLYLDIRDISKLSMSSKLIREHIRVSIKSLNLNEFNTAFYEFTSWLGTSIGRCDLNESIITTQWNEIKIHLSDWNNVIYMTDLSLVDKNRVINDTSIDTVTEIIKRLVIFCQYYPRGNIDIVRFGGSTLKYSNGCIYSCLMHDRWEIPIKGRTLRLSGIISLSSIPDIIDLVPYITSLEIDKHNATDLVSLLKIFANVKNIFLRDIHLIQYNLLKLPSNIKIILFDYVHHTINKSLINYLYGIGIRELYLGPKLVNPNNGYTQHLMNCIHGTKIVIKNYEY